MPITDEDRELYNTPNQSDLLKNKNNEEIIFSLLSGRDYKNNEIIYFKHPIPNLIFTRDIAAVIGNTILVNWGKRKVRNRENIIGKFIFKHHKLFSNSIIYNFHEHHPNHSIEGGDIIVFGNNIVCIGISERTPKESINALLPLIFNEGFTKVYAIDLPKRRSVMHLDTIFNRINKDEVIIYPPIFDPRNINYKPMAIYSISPNKTLFELEPSDDHFIDLLGNDFKKIKTINCGGDKHNNQIREQWTEGANFFAIKPGVIIGYDCNTFTIEALKDNGYKHIKSNYFLQNSSEFDINSKLVITIPASELSRGRGGTRCLTLPISRESKK